MSPTTTSQVNTVAECEEFCQVCHCTGEGCDGTICHGLDAD
jgi:hypothetical protein